MKSDTKEVPYSRIHLLTKLTQELLIADEALQAKTNTRCEGKNCSFIGDGGIVIEIFCLVVVVCHHNVYDPKFCRST